MRAGKPAKLWKMILVVSSMLMVMVTASMTASKISGLETPSTEEAKAALISIWPSSECRKPGTATGFFITPQGHILTANHVVGGFEIGETVTVQWAPPEQESQLLTATILAKKQEWDTALLQAQEEGEFPWLRLGNSDQVREGDSVTILGFPEPASLGCNTPTLTTGQVTARKPPGELGESYQAEALQISVAPIRPGSSGSPVLNEAGEVIGILFAGTGIPGLGTELPFYFAVPINVAIDAVLALRPQILPPYSPEITYISFPPEIKADGQLYTGKIGFRDLNGDLNIVRFEPVEAQEVTVEPPEIFVQAFPELRGKIQGEVQFKVSTTVAQHVRLRVTLIDLIGNRSEPRELTFEAVSPYNPPEIIFFHCPERIPADGQEYLGVTGFKDPEGDIVLAVFDVVRGQYQPFTLNLREYPRQGPVFGQQEGEFEFSLKTTTPSEVTLKLTLIDNYGLESQPKECSFIAEVTGPPPVIQVEPSSLSFSATVGGSDPPPQSITITNAASGSLSWTVTVDVPWLSLSHTSGTAPPSSQVTVSVNTTDLPEGRHEGKITITAPRAQNSPVIVPAHLILSPPSRTFLVSSWKDNGIFQVSSEGEVTEFARVSAVDTAVDLQGSVFAIDGDERIVKVTPGGLVTTIFRIRSPLSNPVAIAVTSSGTLIVGDNAKDALYQIDQQGSIRKIADLPTKDPAHWQDISIAVDTNGDYIVTDDSERPPQLLHIRASGEIETIAYIYDTYLLTSVKLDPAGGFFVIGPETIFHVSQDGVVSSIATGFHCLVGLVVTSSRTLWILDGARDSSSIIYKVSPFGTAERVLDLNKPIYPNDMELWH